MSVARLTGSPQAEAFHEGQKRMQTLVGTRRYAQSAEGWFGGDIDPGLVDIIQHAQIIYVAYQSDEGHTWVTAISAQPQLHKGQQRPLVEVVGVHRVRVSGVLVSGDPIVSVLSKVSHPVGFTIMQEFTRDRVRINGLLVQPALISQTQGSATQSSVDAAGVVATFELETSFVIGLCPKYIVDRRIIQRLPSRPALSIESSEEPLPADAVHLLRTADTLWLGTTEPTWGSQSSHRGGRPGFIRVLSRPVAGILARVEWGDYNGNNFFHSLGSALSNPRAGVSVLDYQHGHLLQLVGELQVIFADQPGNDLDGTSRHIQFDVHRWRWTEGAVPFVFRTASHSVHNPQLKQASHHSEVKEESNTTGADTLTPMRLLAVRTVAIDVKAFSFEPVNQSVRLHWLPAQYAIMRVSVDGQTWQRSWTLTSLSSDSHSQVEVTIKRAERGVVSRFLHDRARQGLVVQLVGIEGSFSVPSMFWQSDVRGVTAIAGKPSHKLWLSAGIGITPLVAHLRAIDRFYRSCQHAGVSTPPGDWLWLHIDQSLDHVAGLDSIAGAVALSRTLPSLTIHVVFALTRCTADQLTAPAGSVYLRACQLFGAQELDRGGRVVLLAGRPQASTLMEVAADRTLDVKGRSVDACGSMPVMDQFRRWVKDWSSAGQPTENFRTESFAY